MLATPIPGRHVAAGDLYISGCTAADAEPPNRAKLGDRPQTAIAAMQVQDHAEIVHMLAELRLEHREVRLTEVPVGLLSPERGESMLFELARGRLEQVQLPEPVLALRLIARDLPGFVPAGRDLFDERPANALPIEE